MTFLNNPDVVLDEVIDLDQPEDKLFPRIVEVIRTIVGNEWSTASSESVNIKKLTGGITNILFIAENKVNNAKVIVRIYGLGTAAFIDRNSENVVFATLSKLNFGPTFFGLFSNGRLEGYLPALALQIEEMADPFIAPAIASALAKLHCIEVDAIKSDRWLWTKIETFMTLAENASRSKKVHDGDASVNDDKVNRMRAEVVWLEQYLQEREQEYVAGLEGQVVVGEDEEKQRQRLRGRKYGMSECLCHNDLLSGNILLRNQQLVEAEALLLLPSPASSESAEQQEEEKKPKEGECTTGTVAVHIIDYEYAAYNYRAFDIANHFSEYCGFDYDLDRFFPSEQKMRFFLKCYLKQQQQQQQQKSSCALDKDDEYDEDFVDGYMDAVRWTLLASHLFWGSWALVQAACSSIDFDYAGYAQRRFAAFFLHKEQLV